MDPIQKRKLSLFSDILVMLGFESHYYDMTEIQVALSGWKHFLLLLFNLDVCYIQV